MNSIPEVGVTASCAEEGDASENESSDIRDLEFEELNENHVSKSKSLGFFLLLASPTFR